MKLSNQYSLFIPQNDEGNDTDYYVLTRNNNTVNCWCYNRLCSSLCPMFQIVTNIAGTDYRVKLGCANSEFFIPLTNLSK